MAGRRLAVGGRRHGQQVTGVPDGRCNFVRCTNMQWGYAVGPGPDRMHDCACGSTTPTGGAAHRVMLTNPTCGPRPRPLGEISGLSQRLGPRTVPDFPGRVAQSSSGAPGHVCGVPPSSSCHVADHAVSVTAHPRTSPDDWATSAVSTSRSRLRGRGRRPAPGRCAAAAVELVRRCRRDRLAAGLLDHRPQLVAARAVPPVGEGEGVEEGGRRGLRGARAEDAVDVERGVLLGEGGLQGVQDAHWVTSVVSAALCWEVEAAMLASTRARSPLAAPRQPRAPRAAGAARSVGPRESRQDLAGHGRPGGSGHASRRRRRGDRRGPGGRRGPAPAGRPGRARSGSRRRGPTAR